MTTISLYSVSCASVTFCVAAGNYFNAQGSIHSLLVIWNGFTWSLDDSTTLSVPSPSQASSLKAVSCASPSYCVAAGTYLKAFAAQNFVLTWNGSVWSLDDAASLSVPSSTFNVLDAVSCTSAAFCVAGGSSRTGTVSQNFVLTWNGSAWTLDDAASLSTSTRQINVLKGVSCATPSFCVAAGYVGSLMQGESNILLIWNGNTWALDDAASLSSSVTQANTLEGVSCTSARFCIAAGYYDSGTANQDLALTWNGSAWTLDDAASLSSSGPQENSLNSISCASQSFCVAVGSYINGKTDQGLVLTWNGSTWSLAAVSALSGIGSQFSYLSGVSCASERFCVAVGTHYNVNTQQNFVLTWNGSAWTLDEAASLSTSTTQADVLTSSRPSHARV
ncbi:MAG: hypothetical protein ACYDEY_12410 [Acidimicrobiales bacterium]